MSDNNIQDQIDEVQNEIDILNSQKKLLTQICDICKRTKCDVLSFVRKKPVHSKCHEQKDKGKLALSN